MSAPKKIYLSKLVMAGAEILDKPVSDDDVEYIRKDSLMKEAVEGTIDYVYDEKGDAYKAIRFDWLVGDFGDKVRVIVLPKED